MTTPDLQARLKSLFEANRSISHLTTKLSKLAPSGPADGQPEDSITRVELSAEIHQSLKDLEEEFELVKQEAEDFTSTGNLSASSRRRDTQKDQARIAVATQVERLGEDLKSARSQFRKAQLQAKRSEEAAKRKEREQLFAGIQEGSRGAGKRRGQEKLSQDEILVGASSDVTSALRRTHQLMQSELERSQYAHETLKASTAALKSLNETYSTLDNLLSSSKSLITTLVTSQKSDTWYLETAFWILLYTIAWLVFRRFFYGPIRYFLYLPTKWIVNIFLTISNVAISALTGGAAASTSLAVGSSSASLKVQPSAKGKGPRMMVSPSIVVGAGGVKSAFPDEGSLSDKVGRMAEERGAKEKQHAEGQTGGESGTQTAGSEEGEDVGGGDGGASGETVLRERRADEKANPKKRMFEEPPAGQRVRDEL